jgi:hypothetical protein
VPHKFLRLKISACATHLCVDIGKFLGYKFHRNVSKFSNVNLMEKKIALSCYISQCDLRYYILQIFVALNVV